MHSAGQIGTDGGPAGVVGAAVQALGAEIPDGRICGILDVGGIPANPIRFGNPVGGR